MDTPLPLSFQTYAHLATTQCAALDMPPLVQLPLQGDLAGVVTRVVDGDSVKIAVLVDVGTLRVVGIDAPELATAAGKQSKRFAESILPLGHVLLVRLEQQREKFGRLLGNIQLPDGEWLSEAMVSQKYARRYDGGKR